MALATVEDVRRMLKIPESSVDDERDRQLADALDAASSWVSNRLRQRYDESTGGTYTAYDHLETDEILLPRVGCTVTEVRVTLHDDSYLTLGDAHVLTSDQYDVIEGLNGNDIIRLRPSMTFAPFEGAVAQRYPRLYRKVEIDWEPPDSGDLVPAAVRDATALLAAGMWKTAPRLAGGIKSEKIGDYSYTLDDLKGGEGSDYWSQAMRLLRPFRRTKPMVT